MARHHRHPPLRRTRHTRRRMAIRRKRRQLRQMHPVQTRPGTNEGSNRQDGEPMSRLNTAVWGIASIFWVHLAHSAIQSDEFWSALVWLTLAMGAAYVALIFYDKGAE